VFDNFSHDVETAGKSAVFCTLSEVGTETPRNKLGGELVFALFN